MADARRTRGSNIIVMMIIIMLMAKALVVVTIYSQAGNLIIQKEQASKEAGDSGEAGNRILCQ